MKKIIPFLIMYAIGISISAQVPQGFNYQAVARDLSGNVIPNTAIDVRIGILSDIITPVVVWEEEHAVNTNSFGLFTLTIGDPAAIKTDGSASSFAQIDWSGSPLFIRCRVDNGGWYEMGKAQLWSVPYAMLSDKAYENLSSPFLFNGDTVYIMDNFSIGSDSPMKAKLAVTGDDYTSEDALFEVKRSDGQTVFAVYNEGVRVYVPTDPLTKGPKGGFAIGGFDRTKGEYTEDYMYVTADSIRMYIDKTPDGKGLKGGFAIGGFDRTKAIIDDYMVVNADSTRIYIDDSGTKGPKGGFAIGGFDRTKANRYDYMKITQDSTRFYIDDTNSKGPKGGFAIGGFDRTKGNGKSYFDVATDTTGVISPSENRVSWYPLKNAFISGKVLVESPDSIGTNSMATGFESKSIGDYSQALGYKSIARGDYSTAIGKNAIANDHSSFAFGSEAKAKGDNSFSFGQWARAENTESYALGRGAIAEGFRSFAFGSAGIDSAGVETGVAHAIGDYSFALGQGSIASGFGSFTLGLADTASGSFSIAIGYKTKASEKGSAAIGYRTTANGIYSTVLGYETVANGAMSIAMGNKTTASANYSTAMGWKTIASGPSSTSMGKSTTASGFHSTAMGFETIASSANSTAMGTNTTASGAHSTAMGARTTASGGFSTAMGWYTIASGNLSAAMGKNTIAKAYSSFVIGFYNDTLSTSSKTTWQENDPLFVVGNGTSGSNRSNALTVLKNGNVILDDNLGLGTQSYGGGSKVFAIENGTVPTSSISNGVLLYAEDEWHNMMGYWSELKVRDEFNGITTLSPHNFSMTEKSEPMAWSFYSENHNIGQKINVDVLKAIRLIEELSGEKLVFIEYLDGNPADYPHVKYLQDNKDEFISLDEHQIQIEEKDREIQSLKERLGRIEAMLGIGE